ncbi:MAG TPA: putative manganese-dependent inorganic diphosphatase [Syntrophomonas wolfei]|uniref:inorganic diphosphatase n=1 Tax=Syntrophomonas wolfei TaxID=863 RepID=A0A354Z1U3_9FIRM|nr:putative manganese-dependent inorganic diphosphatase [Syntrophomonas wolfei]
MKAIYVIGHKNPDIDAVAAAIAYLEYKEATDQGLYLAAMAGEMSDEIDFVLEAFDFAPPLHIKNVKTTVEDLLDEKEPFCVCRDMNLMELSNILRRQELKTVPVVDEKERLLGLITIGDMAMLFMNSLLDMGDLAETPGILGKLLDRKVTDIMKTRDLILFEKDEAAEEARKLMLSTRFRNYPVVDEENRFLGIISRYHLLNMRRKKLILVDHNEKKQAVDGVEEAEILEIVDHHRVGDLQTISPIYFHNEPVGSTSTLVAEKFISMKLALSKNLAGLLLSGILSDTMLFKSPTTTGKDLSIAAKLQDISGLEPLSWGKAIFENSHQLDKRDDEELIYEDLKEYSSEELIFAISQIETVDLASFSRRKASLLKSMQEICERKAYAFICLMVTGILEEGTELLFAGEKSSLVERAFGLHSEEGEIFLQGVMSRKKQVVPVIYEALRQQNLL